jgi:hypothetical protein
MLAGYKRGQALVDKHNHKPLFAELIAFVTTSATVYDWKYRSLQIKRGICGNLILILKKLILAALPLLCR